MGVLNNMKTIRLLYPDHVSGGLDTYYFGANLLQLILPQNSKQPVVKVDVIPPNNKEKVVTNGIYAFVNKYSVDIPLMYNLIC